jgi:hypothetical protein
MTYEVKKLDRSWNEVLLQLANTSTTGSDLFYVDRSPDFFRLGEEFGDTEYFGVIYRKQLVGCIGVSLQVRWMNGKPERTLYLHDLRIHPEFRKTFSFYRLIRHAINELKNVKNASWAFGKILDTNEYKFVLTKGRSLFPKGQLIGRTLHVGVPLFLFSPRAQSNIMIIEEDEAWSKYQTFMKGRNFAIADEKIFKKGDGIYLAVIEGEEIAAVCKVVDQTTSRKLRLQKPLPLGFRLLNHLCRLKGCPELPGKDEIFYHAYLSYFAAKNEKANFREQFLRFIAQQYYPKYTYIFYGIPFQEKCKKPFFSITLSSSTYAYGDLPNKFKMDFHELTLI